VPRAPLTDHFVRSIKDGDHRTYWDTSMPGFGIRCGIHRRTWTVMVGTQRQRITVGRYPTMTLKEARKEARKLLDSDHCPSPTVSEVIEEYVRLHLTPNNRYSTARETERLLRRHLESHHATRKIASLSAKDVTGIIDDLHETPSTANHALVAIKGLFSFAVAKHHIPQHPLTQVRSPFKPGSRDRVLTDSELARIFRAANEREDSFGRVVSLLILTGQRRGEIANLQWSYIDTDAKLITLPKEAAKNGREHAFPYGQTVAAILNRIPPTSPFLFRVDYLKHGFPDWTRTKSAFDHAIGITAPWTLHDLRRTFSTNLARLQVQPSIIERLLNHISGEISGVAAIYNRYNYMSEMRAAVEQYEDFLKKIMDQKA
jgi:integrase